MRLISLDEYVHLPVQHPTYLIRDTLLDRSFNIHWGPAKSGKTILTLQLAHALTTGTPWLGQPVSQTGRVLLLELDTPQPLLTQTLVNLEKAGHPLSHQDILTPHPEDLPSIYPLNVLNPLHYQQLSAMVHAVNPLLVIVDCLAETSQHDENEATDTRKVVQALKHLTVFHPTSPCACWLIHHTVKFDYQNEKSPIPAALKAGRGSSYLAGAADCVWFQHRILSDEDPNALLKVVPRAAQPWTWGLKQQAGGAWLPGGTSKPTTTQT